MADSSFLQCGRYQVQDFRRLGLATPCRAWLRGLAKELIRNLDVCAGPMKAPLNTLRSQQMREILGNEVVRRIAGGVEKLPSLPETYSALCRAAADPNADMAEIARLIALDPAISVRVLQLVNWPSSASPSASCQSKRPSRNSVRTCSRA